VSCIALILAHSLVYQGCKFPSVLHPLQERDDSSSMRWQLVAVSCRVTKPYPHGRSSSTSRKELDSASTGRSFLEAERELGKRLTRPSVNSDLSAAYFLPSVSPSPAHPLDRVS
jgi:hypothetical protein